MAKFHAYWSGKKFPNCKGKAGTFCGGQSQTHIHCEDQQLDCLDCLQNFLLWMTDPACYNLGYGRDIHIKNDQIKKTRARIIKLTFGKDFKGVIND